LTDSPEPKKIFTTVDKFVPLAINDAKIYDEDNSSNNDNNSQTKDINITADIFNTRRLNILNKNSLFQ